MKTMRLTLLITLINAMLFGACNAQTHTSSSVADYAIAYNVLVDGDKDDYEVFVMNMDGANKRNVTNLAGVEWTYLAAGEEIYFISDKDTCKRCYFLYRTNANGANAERVADFQLRDSWMSSRNNGTELVVTPHPKIDSVFYIINRNGKLLHKLNPGLTYLNDPAFSPDGKQIAFRGANKKFKKETGFIDEIYVMNADGSNLRQVTHYPESDTTAAWYNYHAGPPMWHPTENFISFQSFQNGKYSLYAVSPNGSKQWKLTNNKESEGWHYWSPDGKWLAIELFDNNQTQFNIGLMNWKTKALKTLTDTTYKYQQAPVFVKSK